MQEQWVRRGLAPCLRSRPVWLTLGIDRLRFQGTIDRGASPCGVDGDTRIEPIDVFVLPDQNDVEIDAALDESICGIHGDTLGAARS